MESELGVVLRFPRERSAGAWVSPAVVAREFEVSVRTVERWRALGCPFVQPRRGGVVRMQLGVVREWLRERSPSV